MTLKTNTKIACAVLAAAFTFGTISVPAQAEPVEFVYRPAELANADALHARIRLTARRACQTRSSLVPRTARRQCRDAVEAQLVAQTGLAAANGSVFASAAR